MGDGAQSTSGSERLSVEDVVDHESDCAACGVHDRVEDSRYCAGCRDALVRADGGSDRKVCLDLFSGLGGFSAAFEDAPGWDVVTVDIKEKFAPDIQADVLDLMPSDLVDVLGDVDVLVILAGHPCTLFSLAGNHDAWDFESREPLTPEARNAVASVYHTLGLIKGLDPDYWFLENPRGRLRWFLGEPTGTVMYCQYGEDWQKPTDLWGEHPPGLTYRSCSPGDPCHEQTSQDDDDSGCLANSMRDPAKRAKVPFELSKEILDAVEGRTRQTTLVPDGGAWNGRDQHTDTEQ